MALPVGLQLGVELTNFVMPLTKTALRLGTLAAREAIERSGSDELTELKLAHILGRLRLDPAISTHFRSIVARSSWTAVSRFINDVVLESGAGPTVAQALASDNPALLSMIVQLSFLAWSHEHQSLGQAITQLVDDALLESQRSTANGLNYVALLGTIDACQQQTAAFSWEPHYKAVADKLKLPAPPSIHMKNAERAERPSRLSSRRQVAQIHQSFSNRGIPFAILSALLQFLEPVQRLPDEYLLELTCGQGVDSVVIWCYHILGLSVAVKLGSDYFRFGDEPCSITINACPSLQVSAVLLQRASPSEPLFTLQRTDMDPCIQSEERAPARGFLRTILERHGFGPEDIERMGGWFQAKCRDHFYATLLESPWGLYRRRLALKNKFAVAGGVGDVDVIAAGLGSGLPNQDLGDEILPAVSFLLDSDLESVQRAELGEDRFTSCQRLEELRLKRSRVWQLAIMLIYTFARVKDRDECGSMPLSVTAFERLSRQQRNPSLPSVLRCGRSIYGQLPDTTQDFELLCQLLFGQRYSTELSSNAFLVSDRGWSIFFGSIDAVDPADVLASGRLHVSLGVPARDGVRKARIVDAMAHIGQSSTEGTSLTESRVKFWPGVSTSKLAGTHVGYQEHDVFTVTQMFDWTHSEQGCKKRRLGFRLQQEISLRCNLLAKCPCDPDTLEADALRTVDDVLREDAEDDMGKKLHSDPGLKISSVFQTHDRIFQRGDTNTWYFFVTNNGAARWLALDELCHLGKSEIDEKFMPRFVRGPGCCVRCAINMMLMLPDSKSYGALVLL